MENNKLSDLEIKLINVTKKFVSELNQEIELEQDKKRISMKELRGHKYSIDVENPYLFSAGPLASLRYINGAGTGIINIVSNIAYKYNKLPKNYKEMLIKEIPEIKDRIKMKWVEK